jgi:hypothetical protein
MSSRKKLSRYGGSWLRRRAAAAGERRRCADRQQNERNAHSHARGWRALKQAVLNLLSNAVKVHAVG